MGQYEILSSKMNNSSAKHYVRLYPMKSDAGLYPRMSEEGNYGR